MRILLAEDDTGLGAALYRSFKKSGYTLDWIRNGNQALQALQSNSGYEAMVLDLGLPGLDGVQVLERVRARRDTLSVVVISACDQVDQRVDVLTAGADDYLTKPFEVRELMARILAVVRRKGGMPGPLLSNGDIELHPVTREAHRNGHQVHLSAREFDVLQALLIRPGAILSRAQIEEHIYGWGQEVDSNAIEFLIHGLRQKLGKSAILNVRGVGWYVTKATEPSS